jgi:hypothetical protein
VSQRVGPHLISWTKLRHPQLRQILRHRRAAIIAILASGATGAAQVGAALIFTLVAFTVVEVPLISYLATPEKTLAVVQRLNDWISAPPGHPRRRRRRIRCLACGYRHGQGLIANELSPNAN